MSPNPGIRGRWALLKKYYPVILVILAGCLLMLLPQSPEKESASGDGSASSFDLPAVQGEMEEILSRIDGAGRLQLMLTLQSGMQLQVAQDETLSYSGSVQQPDAYERKRETVRLSQGSGTQEALVTGQLYPGYQGALVVCEGADRASVRLAVTEAVSALTGLGADRISVVKWQS